MSLKKRMDGLGCEKSWSFDSTRMQRVSLRTTRRGRVGFTLVELLIYMSVASIIFAIALVTLTAVRKTGRDSVRKQNLNQYRTGLEQYLVSAGAYPDQSEGLDALVPSIMSSHINDPLPSAVNPTMTYLADDTPSYSYVLYTNLEMEGYWVACSVSYAGGKVGKVDVEPTNWNVCPL